MRNYQQFRVRGSQGLSGTMYATSRFLDESEFRLLKLENGREYLVPADAVQPLEDGSYTLRITPAELERYARAGAEQAPPAQPSRPERQPAAATTSETVIPALAEELHVDKRTVETGRVRVHKNVTQTESVVDEPLIRDEYEIARVPVNRIVDGPVETRQEGDTTIIPLLEEVLVVEKRLVLREEVHITRKRQEIHDPKRVTLRKEDVEIERAKPAGS